MIKKIKKEQMLIAALFGILCLVIAIPVQEKEEKESSVLTEDEGEVLKEETMEQRLKEVLQMISGVGEVEVFITYADKGKILVEKDESVSEEMIQETDGKGGTRTTTTVQSDSQTVYGTGENPYVVQQLLPEVEGILVVAKGAGNLSVKKQIQETIEALFGLETHKISIMKMEVSK